MTTMTEQCNAELVIASLSLVNYVNIEGMEKCHEREEEAETAEFVFAKEESVTSDMVNAREHTENAKARLSLVVLGHVDAGKATLGASILHHNWETEKQCKAVCDGICDVHVPAVQNLIAWDIPVEAKRTYFETESKRYHVLDVPANKNYLRSMISGTYLVILKLFEIFVRYLVISALLLYFIYLHIFI